MYKALARAECDTRDLFVAMHVYGSPSLVALISFGLWTAPLRLLVSCSAGDDKPAWPCVQESLQQSLQHALQLQTCQTCRICLPLHHDGSNRSLVPHPAAVGPALDLDPALAFHPGVARSKTPVPRVKAAAGRGILRTGSAAVDPLSARAASPLPTHHGRPNGGRHGWTLGL